jgi:ABC-type sugar transport system substrate-binding protein
MTTKLTFSLLAVSFLAIAPALAQSSNAQEEDKSAKARSVTGCLSPGDSADEFKLTQDDGSTWEIRARP